MFKILRTENKNRQRPDPESRFVDQESVDMHMDQLKLLNPKDLEWLAWNWRAWNNQRIFSLRRLMIFGYLNYSFEILPTPE